MNLLWVRTPLWLLVDGGVRSLPPAAQLALVHIAATGGFTRCGDDARGALEALAAGAGASFERMIDRGVVEHEGGVLRLVPPADSDAPSLAEAYGAQVGDSAQTRSASPGGEGSGPRRPPSHSPESQRRRKVLSWFNHRAGPCRDVPPAATWEQWSASAEGVALLAVGRPRHHGNNPPRVVPAGGGNLGGNPGTTQEQPRNNPPSNSPFSEETRRNEGKGAAGTRAQEQPRNKGAGTTRPQEQPLPASAAPGTPAGFTLHCAEEVLHTIRSRSDGRFSTRFSSQQINRFHALCCELMERGTTREEIERIGDHIRHGGLEWSKRPDVGALIAEGKDQRGPQLPRILTDMDGCAACGGKPAPSDDLDPWTLAERKGVVT